MPRGCIDRIFKRKVMKTIGEKLSDYLDSKSSDSLGSPINALSVGFKDGYAEALRWRDPEEDMCTLENEGKFILIKYRLIDDFHLIGDAFYNHTVYIKDRIARLPDGEYLRNNPVMVLYGWRPIE